MIALTRPKANPNALYVRHSGDGASNQFTIETDHSAIEIFERDYVSISGFFGTHNPEVFAKAPEMFKLISDIEAGLTADSSYRLFREECRRLLCKIGGAS